jgi:hypothetical protein
MLEWAARPLASNYALSIIYSRWIDSIVSSQKQKKFSGSKPPFKSDAFISAYLCK